MKRQPVTRRSALQLGSVVLLLGVQHIARGATIVAVRVWPSKDYTRLTIESDGEIKAKQFFIADPPRLAVDMEGIDLIPALRELVAKVKSDDPNISGIRVGQNAPGVVRLVIDLKQPIQPQVFTLPPVAAYQYRLVFDLYPTQVADPLEALIAEKLADRQPGATPAPANDPIADLIARTEIANANSQSSLEGYKGAREDGVDVKKEWLLGPDPCPICEENAAAGPIDLDDEFPSGDDAPTAHPNCECALMPVVIESSDSNQAETE